MAQTILSVLFAGCPTCPERCRRVLVVKGRVLYRLEGFSVERLMHFLTALDRDVEIVIRPKPRSRKGARILVTAA